MQILQFMKKKKTEKKIILHFLKNLPYIELPSYIYIYIVADQHPGTLRQWTRLLGNIF